MKDTDRFQQITNCPRVSIGAHSYEIYNVAPSSFFDVSFKQLIEELKRISSIPAIALLSAPLIQYAGRDDTEIPWFQLGLLDSLIFNLNALASSLDDAMVFDFSQDLANHLSHQETSADLLITSRAVGRDLLREMRLAFIKSKHCTSINLTPAAAFQQFKNLWSPRLSKSTIQSEAMRLQHRFIYISGLGEALSTIHCRGSLHGDVHSSNFLLSRTNNVIPVDSATARFPLLGPNSHQCSGNID